MKRVKVVNTITGTPITIETSATTFGQLKEELAAKSQFREVDWNNTVVIQRDSTGRATKSLNDEAISSEEAFTLFISPSKHKGGVTSPAVLRELKNRLCAVLDELIVAGGGALEDATPTASKRAFPTVEAIRSMNFDELVEVIDEYNFDVDASDYDEYDASDMNLLRAEIIACLDIPTTTNAVTAKPSGLSAEEERDLAELRNK